MPQPVGDRDRFTLTARSMTLLCAGLPWTAGCSFVAVSGPPPDHARREYFDCTTSHLAPAIDLGFTAVAGLVAMSEILSDDTSDRERPLAIGIPIALAAVTVISALNGLDDASACTSAKLALARRLAEKREQGPAPAAGCHADVECKGERICVARQCIDPPPFAPPNVPPPQPAAPASDAGAPAEASPQPAPSSSQPTPPVLVP